MVPSISTIRRDAIFRKGNLFVATKPESRKQSEEPKSTNPSKADGMSDERRVAYSDLDIVADAIPRCRVGSPVYLI